MKLFLSSMHPSNQNALLSLLERNSRNVTVIPNAWDPYPRDRFEQELGHTLDCFSGYGLATTQLDLRATSKERLVKALNETALVWVMAGNTFYLNYWLHTSGFAGVIKDALQDGLVYGGESAGAAVAGPTIHGVENVDDPNSSPKLVWEGLGLVDFGVIPHYGWEKYRQPLEEAKIGMAKYCPVRTITNQQAITCIDDKIEVIDNPSDEAE